VTASWDEPRELSLIETAGAGLWLALVALLVLGAVLAAVAL
jgi:hypothetical protein